MIIGEPRILVPLHNQFVFGNGSSVVFLCNVLSFPEHFITWTFINTTGNINEVGTTMSNTSVKYMIVSMRNATTFGQLTIAEVDYNDRGTYVCTVTNIVGSVIATAELTVQGMVSVSTLL